MKAAEPKSSENEGNQSHGSYNRNSVNKKYMNNDDNGFALGDIIGDQLKDRR